MSETSNQEVLMTEVVLPSHTNALGTIFGGVVMGWIDVAGAIAAMRYARSPVVTVSVDYLHFIAPIKTGYTVEIRAKVTGVGNTSMETEVFVEAENSITGKRQRATHSFLTYVALDEAGKPKKVPKLSLPTDEQQEALKRRNRRLEWRDELADK